MPHFTLRRSLLLVLALVSQLPAQAQQKLQGQLLLIHGTVDDVVAW